METAQAALWVVLILVIMAHRLVTRHSKQFVTCPDRRDHGGCQCQGGCGFVAHSWHPENHCVIFVSPLLGFLRGSMMTVLVSWTFRGVCPLKAMGVPIFTIHTITGAIVGVGVPPGVPARCAGVWQATSSGRGS